MDTAPREEIEPGTLTGTTIESLMPGETYSIVVTALSGGESADSLAVLKTTGL